MATRATPEEIGELIGEDVDEIILERIANTGASIDEVNEAVEDRAYERRFGEARDASSSRVEEVRAILDELPESEEDLEPEDEEHEGLSVIEPEDLAAEPR